MTLLIELKLQDLGKQATNATVVPNFEFTQAAGPQLVPPLSLLILQNNVS